MNLLDIRNLIYGVMCDDQIGREELREAVAWLNKEINQPIAHKSVVFEAWSVADLRERIEENDADCPKLKSLSDAQFYELLEYLSSKDWSDFYNRVDGLDLPQLEEYAETYFKGDL